VPEQATNPILILTGPPGVGKSSTAEILTTSSSLAVHLESDAFFRFIRAGYVEPWKRESHAQNRDVMRIVGEAAAGYSGAGYLTVIDGIVLPDWFLPPLRDALRGAGHEVAYAVLRAPLPVCIERARQREREPLAKPEVVEQLWRDFADLGELERNAVDVTERSSSEVAGELDRLLADGRLLI
jgi:tRNA uridine 5-carbamoylmethylation protein Kti12